MDKSSQETKLQFPSGFLLGAASAAHQVEGNNTASDWWYWEQQGRLPKSGVACDHYNKFDEDFGIAQDIGLNAMRISIEWARIEPTEGKWSASAVEHYKKVLLSMKAHGLTRIVTLWHWTLPKWLADKGGLETKEGVEAFARYTWFVAQNLGKEIDFWITLNEPEVYALASYKRGQHPPFKTSTYLSWRVTGNLIEAHRASYKAIKQALGDVPVGISKNSAYFEAFRKNNLADRFLAFFAKQLDYYILEKIQDKMDFIGLNYYFYNRLKFDWKKGYIEMNHNFDSNQLSLEDANERSDMGWFLYPEGIYHTLKSLKKFNKPIYVTENGLADALDSRRPKFLRDILTWIMKAIKDGVNVKGYLHWTLTDNYEWHNGFGPRFGLVEMDYVTQARKVRSSAKIFKEITIK